MSEPNMWKTSPLFIAFLKGHLTTADIVLTAPNVKIDGWFCVFICFVCLVLFVCFFNTIHATHSIKLTRFFSHFCEYFNTLKNKTAIAKNTEKNKQKKGGKKTKKKQKKKTTKFEQKLTRKAGQCYIVH